MLCGTNRDVMWKSSTLLRWGTRGPKNHLAKVWVLVSFIEQIAGEEEELNSGKLLQIFLGSGHTSEGRC